MPLPYGLQWTDLPDFATNGNCYASHEIRGLHHAENSRICALSYITKNGIAQETTVFIKKTTETEVRNHQLLVAAGFPLPAMVATAKNVLVLEFLPAIGIRPTDADEFLRLIARLNAIEIRVAAPPGLPGGEHGRRVHRALAQLDAADYFRIYKEIDRQTAQFPLALTHGELAFQQVGRTGGRLVFFDLATLGDRARFFDIANVITDLATLTEREENDLFGTYLGRAPTAHDRRELLLTRASIGFAGLPWRTERGSGANALARLTAELGELGCVGSNGSAG